MNREEGMMQNPWRLIALSDYENHMRLDSVQQLQTLNAAMREQLGTYPVSSGLILGVAGGNGLEHVDTEKYRVVYGVDVNAQYLKEAKKRYLNLEKVFQGVCLDLLTESEQLPKAELVIANLLIEYIGYPTFQHVVKHVSPKYVSCIIQVNEGEEFVSDSPYLHAFDGLEAVHHQMEGEKLTEVMAEIGYRVVLTEEYPLPNGKKLVRLDYAF